MKLLVASGPGEPSPVAADRLREGQPAPRVWDLHSDATGQFYAGQWAADVGRWQVEYEPHEEEFCLLIEGSVRLTDRTGCTLTFRAGDAFVVPGGFRGEWCNLTPVRKHYAIMNLKDKETRS
jgi:uncharacterized cupin superfamily protein